MGRGHALGSSAAWLAFALAACGGEAGSSINEAGVDAAADTDAGPTRGFSLLTYNVAGLPEGISASHPETNMPLISSRLNDYDIVEVQEDFAYHPQLIASSTHAYRTTPDRPKNNDLGDGLNVLSVFPLTPIYRETWQSCYGQLDSGSDCLTDKGFALVQVELAPGVSFDLYDVHADAGLDPGSTAARADNFRQLARAIAEHSAGRAVIVGGDFNERYYTNGSTLSTLLAETGLTDVWVQLENNGQVPSAPPAVPALCAGDPSDLSCERIDKVLYRSSSELTLTPLEYSVEAGKFRDAQGRPLSDHEPVSVLFGYRQLPP
jgi:endonuclease/exonuclease/phosphatase family metal-dependent hydrolase